MRETKKQPPTNKELKMELTFHSVSELAEFYSIFEIRKPVEEPVETRKPVEEPVETRKPVEEPVEITEKPVEIRKPVETRKPVEEPVETIEAVKEPVETIEVDSEGVEWNGDLHSANKSKTKDGKWRKKKNAVLTYGDDEVFGKDTDEDVVASDNYEDRLQKVYNFLSENKIDIMDLNNILANRGVARIADLKNSDLETLNLIITDIENYE